MNTASISGLIPWPGKRCTTRVKVSVICPGPVQWAIWNTSILGSRAATGAIPANAISAAEAAAIIWRGVQANKASIIFPRQSRMAAWIYRLHPKLLEKRFSRHLRRVSPG